MWNSLITKITNKYQGGAVDLHTFIQELNLEANPSIRPLGTVSCFTLDASRGLEFRHVYLTGLVEDIMPSWPASKNGDFSPEMLEERHNCFAALTRAQECATITYSKNIFGEIKKPSRFLSEMGFNVEK